jgi:hypothetical protein
MGLSWMTHFCVIQDIHKNKGATLIILKLPPPALCRDAATRRSGRSADCRKLPPGFISWRLSAESRYEFLSAPRFSW